jgi:uncharacterized protein
MPELFIDTSGWGHLVDPKQAHHSLASSICQTYRHQGHRLVTTNYVIGELVALLTSPLRIPKPTIIAFINTLKLSPSILILHVDVTLDDQAWQLLTTRQDKEWSLVDCTSFIVMQKRGITDALTTDHHFEQAGFIRLLK